MEKLYTVNKNKTRSWLWLRSWTPYYQIQTQIEESRENRQTIQYHHNPSLYPNQNAEEAEVERFYEDLRDLLELTPKKDVLFILGDWNATVGSQETPGVTGKFGLGMRNEVG